MEKIGHGVTSARHLNTVGGSGHACSWTQDGSDIAWGERLVSCAAAMRTDEVE